MLTPQEAFRCGFLLRCADEGLGAAEIEARVKLAGEFAGQVKQAENPLTAIGKWLLNMGVVGMAAAPMAAGGAAGYGLAKLTEDKTTPEEVQRRELIAAYQQQADRLRRTARARQYRGGAPVAPAVRRFV